MVIGGHAPMFPLWLSPWWCCKRPRWCCNSLGGGIAIKRWHVQFHAVTLSLGKCSQHMASVDHNSCSWPLSHCHWASVHSTWPLLTTTHVYDLCHTVIGQVFTAHGLCWPQLMFMASVVSGIICQQTASELCVPDSSKTLALHKCLLSCCMWLGW